jgi:hypothetical protein
VVHVTNVRSGENRLKKQAWKIEQGTELFQSSFELSKCCRSQLPVTAKPGWNSVTRRKLKSRIAGNKELASLDFCVLLPGLRIQMIQLPLLG